MAKVRKRGNTLKRVKDKILSFISGSKLQNVVEHGHFIYDKNTVYCVRESCKGCRYENTCKHDTFNQLEETLNKSTRNNIKFGKIVNKTDWYLPEITCDEDLDYVTRINGRYLPMFDLEELPTRIKKLLVLSESFVNIYKKVHSIKNTNLKTLKDFLLYHPDEEAYYCIKPNCSNCNYYEDCKRSIERRDREMVFVAVDSASQEPEVVTYLSQEPQYVQIFVNHSIAEIDYILDPINELFDTAYGIDVKNDVLYHTFIDWLAFEDKTHLYQFSAVYFECIKSMDRNKLEEAVKVIDEKYNEFLKLRKEGKIFLIEDEQE